VPIYDNVGHFANISSAKLQKKSELTKYFSQKSENF